MAKHDLKTNDRYYWSYCWCIVRTWICPASQLGTLETLYAKRLTTKPFASDFHSHKLWGYGLDSADLLVINHAVPKPSVMWMHRRTAMTQWKPASNGNENKDAAQVVTSKPKHHHKTETMALGWCMRWGTCGFQMQIAKNTRAEFFSFPSPGFVIPPLQHWPLPIRWKPLSTSNCCYPFCAPTCRPSWAWAVRHTQNAVATSNN